MNSLNVTDELIFSHSRLGCFRRCRYQYWLRYMQGYRTPSSIGQIKGTAGHRALAVWHLDYDMSRALEAAEASFVEEVEKNGLKFDSKPLEELNRALYRYFPYSLSKDRFTLLEEELHFVLTVGDYRVQGYIDAIVQEPNGTHWLMEHKFLKRVSTKHLDLDYQVNIYLLAAHALEYPVAGVMYNMVRMSDGPTAKKDPVVRVPQYRNPEGLHAIARELELMMEDVEAFEAGKGGNIWRNVTKDCSWDCGFYPVCQSINDTGEADSVLRNYHRKELE